MLTVCWRGQDGTGLFVLLVGYRSALLVGSDVWKVLWIRLYMGLCSPMCCSEISCLCRWYVWIYSCLYGNNGEVFYCFNNVMVLLMGPYSCMWFRICCG